MFNNLKTVDIKGLLISFGGVQMTGFIDGEYLNVSYDSDFYSETEGVDGECARLKNNKRLGTIQLTLLQTSSHNDILSAFLLADLAGNIPLPFLFKDMNGSTLIECPNAYIKKSADITLSNEIQGRQWTIKCPGMITFVGGNVL